MVKIEQLRAEPHHSDAVPGKKILYGIRSRILLWLWLHQITRLLAAPAPQHWNKQSRHPVLKRVYYVEHQFEAGAVGAASLYGSGSDSTR
jgi:hypothetical protein